MSRHVDRRPPRSCGFRFSCGWAGRLLASVGVADRQGAVGLEGELPVFVVDGVVMSVAQTSQIGDVRKSLVSPPDHMMQMAGVEQCLTTGDRTRRIQRS